MRTVGSTLVVLAILGGAAWADWPMARHDPQRTGTATGHSNLKTPGAYWRYYLGGQLASGGARQLDIDGDGRDELLVIRGGRLVALRQSGAEAWQSPPLNLVGMAALADLDGDGANELVVYSNARAFALDVKTGVLRWSEDAADLGTLGGIRVADVNGDGRADIVVQECGCCQINNNATGYAYSFALGFMMPQRLYTLPRAYCGGANSLAMFDGDGDGHLEELSVARRDVEVLDAATGAVRATSPDLGDWIAASWCTTAALDASPGEEIICYLSSALPVPAGTGHRVIALRYTTPTLTPMWTADIGEVDAAMAYGASSAVDIDGDGKNEIVVSGQTQAGDQVLTILDGATGAVLASKSELRFLGTGALDANGGPLILADTGTGLAALRFRRGNQPSVVWTVPDRIALSVRDWTAAATRSLSDVLPILDLDGDGSPELLVAGKSSLEQLSAIDAHGNQVATFHAAPGAQLNAVVPSSQSTGAIAAVSSDGVATLVDRTLVAQPSLLRIGGFYAPGAWNQAHLDPVIGQLSGKTALLVSDSRHWLSRLDPHDATNIQPPLPTWTVRDAFAPSVVPGAGIAARMIDRTTLPTREGVVMLDGDGAERWRTTVGDVVFGDLTWGLFDGVSPSLAVLWGQRSDVAVHLTTLSGATGFPAWSRSWSLGENRVPLGTAIADWNGDQQSDVVLQYFGTHVMRGTDGVDLGLGGPDDAYFLPTIYDVDGDGVPEVTFSGGVSPLRTLKSDLATSVWTSSEDERPFPYAAVVSCAVPMPVPFLASTSLGDPGRLKLTTMTGASAGASTTLVLAGGRSYPDAAAAISDRSTPGQLTSVFAHTDLGGDGRPVAVVGSSDGWLYAVDACAHTLAWATRFDAPVGAVAFGDTDGDGLDELIVEVADGYLYGMRQAPLAAPNQVWDTDPPDGIVDEDVDSRSNYGQLSARWNAVVGATGYEIAVALADSGGYLTDPPWTPVGNTTAATVAGLTLKDGPRYVFSVRAVGADGVSPDSVTDGVVITGDLQGGQPDGGCCQVDRGSPLGALGLSLATGLLVLRRRGRTRSYCSRGSRPRS